MANLDLLIRAWDEAFWEYGLIFEGLADEDVWTRPHPRLLSIGELTAHVAYYEALMTTEPAPSPRGDLTQVSIKSPLIDTAVEYYSSLVEKPFALSLGAKELLTEFQRVHEEAKASVLKVERDETDPIAGWDKKTWGMFVQYLGFHAAYHAGQAFSVRHLFGHTTTDN